MVLAVAAACSTLSTGKEAGYPRCFQIAADSSNPHLQNLGELPRYLELDTLQVASYRGGPDPAGHSGKRRDAYWLSLEDTVEVSIPAYRNLRLMLRFANRNERHLTGRVWYAGDIVGGLEPFVAIMATRTRCNK
jgi:hypothetical protein